MTARHVTRRSALKLASGIGVASLSGCMGSGGDEYDVFEGEEFVAEEPDYDGWLSDAVSHEGTVDWTGRDEVTVLVGVGSEWMGFGPAAIRIDAGTTVVWEWTGKGGGHNVVDTDGTFESPMEIEEGKTFEYTFEKAGIYTYFCRPHQHRGMKGAVDVV
ncbi:halocyanin domain-containing protein [Natribaculum luteum]|uniref:Halocyanin domain-containing protein n=1 Tax=Natribaculum luteum TaxID=1586232 RepID=A0ABD5P5Z6_9EURY|nr:halocyanin domain-containing protein [Natribaculum luteum]